MTTDLQHHIATTRLVDTHEHLHSEAMFVDNGPDILADLFGMYIGDELIIAGAPIDSVRRLLDSSDPDLAGRWLGVADAWQQCRHTGYGEAVADMARLVYGIEEITVDALEGAVEKNRMLRRPGERLRLLRDVAHLESVQVDDFSWACRPDPSGPDFFLYDLSWVQFADARFSPEELAQQTGVTVVDLASLQSGMEALFAQYGPSAVAVKTQHAYNRTLAWTPRADADAAAALQNLLTDPENMDPGQRLCLGDWCLARGAELAARYNLPVKIHTGMLAGHGQFFTDPDRTRATHLAPLLAQYPSTSFVLMHVSYPYSDELLAIAKHFPNAYVDMCWAWSINPRHAMEFVRRAIHGVPINKLFAFGGDCIWPTEVVGFAAQARRWLGKALRAEIDDGYLDEPTGMGIATRLMQANQFALFRPDR